MKTKLTAEESGLLIKMGLPKNLASETEVEGYYHYGEWTENRYYSYSLDDLLKILPKEIIDNDEPYRQIMLWAGQSYFVGYRNHDNDEWLYQVSLCEELIDGLNKLTIWCLKSKYL